MRRIYVKRTEHVDHSTGEVTHSEESSSFFVKSRHFVKMYLDKVHVLADLSSGARAALDLILVAMEFNDNSVYLDSVAKERIAEMLDKSKYTVRNYLYELEQADIIAKTATNVYRVNPNIFAKGTPKGKPEEANEYEASSPFSSRNGRSPL